MIETLEYIQKNPAKYSRVDENQVKKSLQLLKQVKGIVYSSGELGKAMSDLSSLIMTIGISL